MNKNIPKQKLLNELLIWSLYEIDSPPIFLKLLQNGE